MTAPHYVTCPNCGERHDTSGRFTSPANREHDQRWWTEEHLSGKCVADGARTLTQDRISAALNRAADKVCALAPQDERLGDAINLVVNAALHLLKFPDADLEAVVEANYSEDADTVLGWVRGGQ